DRAVRRARRAPAGDGRAAEAHERHRVVRASGQRPRGARRRDALGSVEDIRADAHGAGGAARRAEIEEVAAGDAVEAEAGGVLRVDGRPDVEDELVERRLGLEEVYVARLAQSSELAAAEKSRDLRGRAAVRGREDTHRAVGGEIDAEPVGAPALDERGRGG